MKRGILRWALALACAATAVSGCELFQHEHRIRSIDEPTSEPDEVVTGQDKSETGKGFFKPGRLSGAMSSEARDIERSLGVK